MIDIPANDRDTVIDVLSKLPVTASLQRIRDEIEDILGILEGQKDIEEGRVYTHEQVMEEMRQCISKFRGQAVPVSN